MSSGLKYDRVNIELRRSKVLSLLAKGLQYQEIAKELGVANSTISVDVQCIKETAADELQHHISEIIPFHYKLVMAGFKDILLAASSIVQTSADDKTRLSALSLMANIYDRIMAVDTNGPTIGMASNAARSLETSKFMLREISEDEKQEQQEIPDEDQEDNHEEE
jgi:orotate phosphoribosyltransferase-like protein